MKAARILKQKINSKTVTTGIVVTNHLWPELVEISIAAGLDYIIIDNEHGAFSPELICDVCAIGRLVNFPILIRPISHKLNIIRKTIDMGPCGLLLPSIDMPEILDEVREAIYMPPRGKRRPGGRGNRWVNNYTYQSWKTEVEDDLIILPQIESQVGLNNAEQIAHHEITTAMAIGPYDLSADLGVCGDLNSLEIMEATQHVRRAAKSADKNMWVIGNGPELVKQGFSFLCLAEPMGLLEASLKNIVTQVKSDED